MSTLSKVLLLGDSIRLSYEPIVSKKSSGKAQVVGPKENCQFSLYTLASLARWLEDLGKPQIVHWNNGLHDCGHNPDRSPIQIPIENYIGNHYCPVNLGLFPCNYNQMHKLKQIMTCIDFKITLPYSGSQYLQGAKHEPRSNYLLTGHGLLSATPIQIMCRSLSRRSSRPRVFLSRSVLLHGLRSTHRPRKSPRYRSLP